jgi:curli biogenesis system outer membrane secretion channel CsgG
MRRSLPAAVTVLALAVAITAALAAEQKAPPKPPAYTGLKKRIGVLPIVVGAASYSSRETYDQSASTHTSTWQSDRNPGEVGAALTEQLTTALMNSGRFVVLERKALDEVLGEQDLGASGRVNQETAAPTGKVIGAEWLVKGTITEYTDKKTRSGGAVVFRGIGLGGTKAEAYVALDVRIIDAATGEVIDSVKADGSAKRSGALGGLAVGGVFLAAGKEDETPIGQATRAALTDAIDFICQRMEQLPWQSRVMEVEGKEVTITGGSNMNVRVGDVFSLFHRGKPLVDPDTGQTLGYRESRLGTLKITEVMDKFSVGQVIEGTAPARGDVVRGAAPPSPPSQPPAEPKPTPTQ